MAALIASRLAKTVYEEFKVKPETVQFWSNSKIVLHWLRSDSMCLKAFVGVRIAEIQSNWDQTNWRYVPTDQNPANDLSRGLPTEHLKGRWMEGPSFLRRPKEEWPIESVQSVVEEDPEKKKSNLKQIGAAVPVNEILNPIEYSYWQRLPRVTVYCMRFLSNVRKRIRRQASGDPPYDGPLVPEEIEQAQRYWIVSAQRQLGNWEESYKDLAPFDKEGAIRVGGRLRNAPRLYEEIHPILLPASHPISKLIMREAHSQVGHGGPERTLSESRRKFWITHGRNLGERQVDLFGPFNLKFGQNRTQKAWGALFNMRNCSRHSSGDC